MSIENIKPSKIIDDLARFDGRRKRYVPYSSVVDDSCDTEKFKILLLADLQTKWEQLRKQYVGNSNFLQSTAKYYRQLLTLNDSIFTPTSPTISSFDKTWLLWSQSLCQFSYELNEKLTPLSKKGFIEFQTYINKKSAQEYKTKKIIKQGWQTITSFIDYQNQNFMLAENYYPKLIAPQQKKSNPLIINANWVTQGKELNKIIRAVQDHWHQTADYNHDEILGWLLFSGIVYGGINEKQMLQGWLTALLSKEYQPFIHQRILISPRFEQKRYGNERLENSDKLFNTKQIILDLVSQCWLIRYHQCHKADDRPTISDLSQEKIKLYITNTLSIVTEPLQLNTPTLFNLLSYASYHWEMLDGVDIDQASVAVLRGDQNTVGLRTQDFNQLLNQKYKNKAVDYDLNDILKLSINATTTSKTALTSNNYKKAEVRKSDLITQITRDFKLTEELKNKKLDYVPPTFIQRVMKRRLQYSDLSEVILLDWVLDMLNQRGSSSDETILKYARTIGYEWLYFTMGQPLDIWSEEDFETLYEDILEHKSIVRGNTDIGYSARLFQIMHNFAENKHGLPAVTIQHSKNGRRVRAELVSPQAYRTIIRQILTSVDILEREMFALLFILVYRTGMRKKELLGLKFNDIEGLNESAPSIVIKPNSYRSTKTQSSIRRIALFALLKPAELNFFINYIQSNIGANNNKFIFTLSVDRRPIEDHIPLQLLKRILKDISTDKEMISHTFHAFRHTAVSNLSLVLLGHTDLIETLTDYDKSDVLRIKKGLLGEHIDAQDHWYALSGMMGHLSPQRSFEYYNHIATLMATYELSVADIKMPIQTIYNITGFTKKQFMENHATINNKNVSMPSIRTFLFKKSIKGIRKSPSFAIETHEHENILDTAPSSNEELFMRYGLNRVQLLLQAYDDKTPLNEAAALSSITTYDAKILIERAIQVATITTTKGKSRFTKLSDSKTTTLSPLKLQHQSDLRLLSILRNNAYQLRHQTYHDWQWFITICKQRLSNSRSFVPFSPKETDELQRFFRIAKRLLPDKNWLITSNKALLEERMLPSDYQGMKNKNKILMNIIHVGISNRDYRVNNYNSENNKMSATKKAKWQYSPLLRFFVHMMLVTDETMHILDEESSKVC